MRKNTSQNNTAKSVKTIATVKTNKTAKRVARKTVKRVMKRPTKRTAKCPSTPGEDDGLQRLQKVLAAAGFGSRRHCEELITAGRVEVDRQTVVALGTKVDPLKQRIQVDGEMLRRSKPVYVALFKPKGVLCTNSDRQGRTRAVDLVPPEFGRLFTIGRLDQHSEGLLLLTNDGELTEKLTPPKYGIPKIY
ncbi:MAG TPA: hypothetical protein DEB39_17035, partial [Planctomycetaceae bacterium]|nr:hypothetical protein [Planctomycetaceae bacterium]